MLKQIITSKTIDLEIYPTNIERKFGHQELLTVPDTHANTILMINFLISFGYLQLEPQNSNDTKESLYQELYQINLTGVNLTLTDTKRFTEILLHSKWNTFGSIRWLGDCLADRGTNDRLTLELFKILSIKKINCCILLSNHDIEFLKIYFFLLEWQSTQPTPPPTIAESIVELINQNYIFKKISLEEYLIQLNPQLSFNDLSIYTQLYLIAGGNPPLSSNYFSTSLFAFLYYLDNLNPEDRDHELKIIQDIVENVYLKQLKLCDLSLGDNQLPTIIYSHAPTSLDVIESLINQYKESIGESHNHHLSKQINHCFKTATHLKNTLDTINKHFSNTLSNQKEKFLAEHSFAKNLIFYKKKPVSNKYNN